MYQRRRPLNRLPRYQVAATPNVTEGLESCLHPELEFRMSEVVQTHMIDIRGAFRYPGLILTNRTVATSRAGMLLAD